MMIFQGVSCLLAVDLRFTVGGVTTMKVFKGDGTAVGPSDGALVNQAGSVYSLSLDAADTDTLGYLWVQIDDTTATPNFVELGEVRNLPLGWLPNNGSDGITMDFVQINSSTGTGLTISGTAGAAGVVVTGSGNAIQLASVDDAIQVTTVNANTVAIIHNGIDLLVKAANTLLDLANGAETGFTVRQFFRLVFGVLMGKSFLTGSTRRFRNPGDTTDRVTATTDNQGQRTAVTLNP